MKPSKEAIIRAACAIDAAPACASSEEMAEAALMAAMEITTLEEATGCNKPYGLIRLEDE